MHRHQQLHVRSSLLGGGAKGSQGSRASRPRRTWRECRPPRRGCPCAGCSAQRTRDCCKKAKVSTMTSGRVCGVREGHRGRHTCSVEEEPWALQLRRHAEVSTVPHMALCASPTPLVNGGAPARGFRTPTNVHSLEGAIHAVGVADEDHPLVGCACVAGAVSATSVRTRRGHSPSPKSFGASVSLWMYLLKSGNAAGRGERVCGDCGSVATHGTWVSSS